VACEKPITVIKAGEKRGKKLYIKDVVVPCGKCPLCKKRRIDEWVFRLQQEDKKSSCSLFVTLTYDTQHVPISAHGFMTLSKGNGRKTETKDRKDSDTQAFFKRLRKDKKDEQIKYYMCGEYGTENDRPHYHLIIFSDTITIDDIEKHWNLGSVHVGEVSGDSIAYCLKYLDKEKRIPRFKRDDRVPEYSISSKNMGLDYVTPDIIKWHTEDLERNYIVKEDGIKIALPRIYKEKIYTEQQKDQQRELAQQAAEDMQQKEMEQYGDKYYSVKQQAQIYRANKQIKQSNKRRNT